MQSVSSNAVANVTKVWTDISSQVTLTITENNANVSINTKKVYMCGALLHFDILCDCYANIPEGGNLCKITVTSPLFTLPNSLSKHYNPSYYGAGVITVGMNVYDDENGVITARMTKQNINSPIVDFSFNATIPCQLS